MASTGTRERLLMSTSSTNLFPPSSLEDPSTVIPRKCYPSFQNFMIDLRRRKVVGSLTVAKQTAEIIRLAISTERWKHAKATMDMVRVIGKQLQGANPLELSIGNIARRVLYIIRREYTACKKRGGVVSEEDDENHPASKTGDEIQLGLVNIDEEEEEDYTKPFNIKGHVLEEITSLIEEISHLYKDIASYALEHIHANEVVMTFGFSHSVIEFLKAAGQARKFEVFVAESAPSFFGQKTALELSNANIDTTVITDSAIFAMMARVNKVIIGTHAVVANGGLIAHSGTHMLALAAKHHAVPVVVCTGLYKLCPLYAYDQDTFNDLNSPGDILKFEEMDDIEHIQVANPAYDYVPPDLVTLFVTNLGGHNPSYVYRLLAEYYYPDDYKL